MAQCQLAKPPCANIRTIRCAYGTPVSTRRSAGSTYTWRLSGRSCASRNFYEQSGDF